jgi:hypothetical protein
VAGLQVREFRATRSAAAKQKFSAFSHGATFAGFVITEQPVPTERARRAVEIVRIMSSS